MPALLSLQTLRKRSMLLTDLVAPNAIIPALKVNSKKQVLQELAAKAAELCGQSERTILEILQQREKLDRKSTRLNSSHQIISYAVFCLKKKKERATSRPPTC